MLIGRPSLLTMGYPSAPHPTCTMTTHLHHDSRLAPQPTCTMTTHLHHDTRLAPQPQPTCTMTGPVTRSFACTSCTTPLRCCPSRTASAKGAMSKPYTSCNEAMQVTRQVKHPTHPVRMHAARPACDGQQRHRHGVDGVARKPRTGPPWSSCTVLSSMYRLHRV